MMHRVSFYLGTCAILVATFVLAAPSHAQVRANDEARVSPNASVSQTIGTTVVTIDYGRPSVRDRDIFGDLVPYDQVWRTGANEATTITFSDDVVVEGNAVEAGTYSLFTIPGTSEWTIILNSVVEQWGAFDYDESQDVVRVTVAPEEASHHEQMTFTFENVTEESAEVVLQWATTRVPFTVETAGR